MQLRKFMKRNRCILSVGIVLFITGVILLILFPIIFKYVINNELVLSPNKHTFEVWKKNPIPLTLEFYFFNWTNPDELRYANHKPNLVELGPYKFKETKEKVDIVWNENGTVTFRQMRRWYFDAENSNGSLTDEITTLNPVAVTAAAQSKNLNYVMRLPLSIALRAAGHDVHITKTVGEFLFDGYEDTLISVAQNFPKMEGVELPPFDKFGWFYKRNGSTAFDGVITMGTGTGDVPLGRIDRWNYRQRTGFYEDHCGEVAGSAGEFWPPYVSKDDISLFSPDMCREVGFQFEKEENVNGISGYRFIGGKKTMDNGTLYPENACYCGGECVPSGVLNVSSCRFGSPGFISFPHFYNADPYYIDQFDGLKPEQEKHEFSITLEPRTGIPLAVSAKFQINLLMKPSDEIGLYRDVPKLFFPMIWFKQEVVIPDNMASDLKQLLNLPTAAETFSIVMTILGFLTVVTLFSIFAYRKIQSILIAKQLQTTKFTKEATPLNSENSPYKNKEIIVIKEAT